MYTATHSEITSIACYQSVVYYGQPYSSPPYTVHVNNYIMNALLFQGDKQYVCVAIKG